MKINISILVKITFFIFILQINAEKLNKDLSSTQVGNKTNKIIPPSLSKLEKFTVYGVVQNTEGRPLQADIYWAKMGDDKSLGVEKSNLFTGDYSLKLPIGDEYTLIVRKKGYKDYTFAINTLESEEQNVAMDIKLLEGEEKTSYGSVPSESELPSKEIVHFCFDRADLKECSIDQLDALIDKLRENPGLEVNITGYTDSIGSYEYNMDLSERRTCTVYRYLLENGIDEEKISCGWNGEENPISPNDSSIGRADNRRTEIEIMLPE
ncbi:MAG: OmpA family protein [Leptospiraceae bacterium]|nr:OmpA family protein [Leptospiraceae bacterium]MCP5494307.1 OmpA family protein [Leptospiraceae bacterium]